MNYVVYIEWDLDDLLDVMVFGILYIFIRWYIVSPA